jgi:hypothetical protein
MAPHILLKNKLANSSFFDLMTSPILILPYYWRQRNDSFGYFDLPSGFTCARSLTKENFRFPDLIDDLLRSVASSRHFTLPSFDP